jgi:hypothetical protein
MFQFVIVIWFRFGNSSLFRHAAILRRKFCGVNSRLRLDSGCADLRINDCDLSRR